MDPAKLKKMMKDKEERVKRKKEKIGFFREDVEILHHGDVDYIQYNMKQILSNIETVLSLVSDDKGKNVSNTVIGSSGDVTLNQFYQGLRGGNFYFDKYLENFENISNVYANMKNIKFTSAVVTKVIKNEETDISYSIVYPSKDPDKEDYVCNLYFIELTITEILKAFKNLSESIDGFSKVINEKVDDLLKKIETTFINYEDKTFEDNLKRNNQTPDEDDQLLLKNQKKRISEITNDPQFKQLLEVYLNRLQNIHKTNGHLLHEMFSFEQLIIKHTRNISTALGKLYDK